MILGVHHPALAVPDLERALEFFCGVLGFAVVMEADLPPGLMETPFAIERAGCKVRMLAKGGSQLELFEFEAPLPADPERPVNRIGITHYAVASDDPPADYQKLADAGVRFNTALQGEAPRRWCYGRDPFGNVIEILEAAEAPAA